MIKDGHRISENFFSQNQLKIMIKKIEISEEVSARLTKKCVKGSLYKDKVTGKIFFRAYNSRPSHKKPDILLRVLEHGWVKESTQRIKVYESIPKNLGTARVCSTLDREMKSVKDVLIDRDIIQFV